MKKVTFIVISFFLLTLFFSNVSADPIVYFSGNTVGSWENVVSTCWNDYYEIDNKSPVTTFNWGKPAVNCLDNQFAFTGSKFKGIATDQLFNIGSFTYQNGSTYNAAGIKGVDLVVKLEITSPIGHKGIYDFDFNIYNTPNLTGNAWCDGDFVTVKNVASSSTFSHEGKKYTLALEGFSKNGGKCTINSFFNPEGCTTGANLYGKITTASVPEPSSASLVFMSLFSLFGFVRRKKK